MPKRISYDNSAIAMIEVVQGRERKLTKEFLRLQSHYLFREHFYLVRRANETGDVERLLGFTRRRVFTRLREPQFEHAFVIGSRDRIWSREKPEDFLEMSLQKRLQPFIPGVMLDRLHKAIEVRAQSTAQRRQSPQGQFSGGEPVPPQQATLEQCLHGDYGNQAAPTVAVSKNS